MFVRGRPRTTQAIPIAPGNFPDDMMA